MSSLVLNVQGMSCGGCSGKVKKAVEAIDGVDKVDVVLETGAVTIDYHQPTLQADQFKEIIEDLGFDVVS
ncbi:copper chaperone CopZ [Acinetobacter puyangensis]|uniref:Copper chaperone n=1 Tax=Acinetobacter puyangensis TaxID=1096779 RepID=A0A240ECP2_9GAMM|nr:cation transporter [Acinetobacter puyangensis]SNX45929.1 copper chaperone [Acinetobacter puyangensis]